MPDSETKINALAAAQFGAFSRAQALECGLSSAAVGRRLTSGRWLRVLPGVYRLASAPRTWHHWLVASRLWAGEAAVISHRAAAALLGLGNFKCTFAELWVPANHKSPSRAIQLHTTKDLSRTDLKKLGPLVVTNATRTLIDLGAVVNPLRLEILLEDALYRGLVYLPRLRGRLAELSGPGRRGPGLLAKVLERRPPGGPAESELEVIALDALRAAELPIPRRQHWVRLGKQDFRIDLAYPDLQIAIECDSVKFHANPRGWDRDRSKSNLLNLDGWTIIRGTWDEVEDGKFVKLVGQALNFRNDDRSASTVTERSPGYDRLGAERAGPTPESEENRWKA